MPSLRTQAEPALSLKVLVRAASAVACALLLAACGGSHKSTTSHSTTSTTTTSKTTTTPKTPKQIPLSEMVSVSKSSSPPGATAKAGSGDAVIFRTHVPGTSKSGPVKVTITVSRGPATKWTATAMVKGKKASATVTSANGKPLTLSQFHYSCTLPPAPSFCPAHHIANGKNSVTVQFKTAPKTPIPLVALVGPPSATSTPSSVVVPAYTLKEAVEARTPTSKAAPTAGVTEPAKPGDQAVLTTHLKGTTTGAPQPLTVTFDQGPGTKLNVSASVPGGTAATATFTSASGKPIALVLPHFVCYLPPTPTFCPPTKVMAASHRYTVTFPASPAAPVRIGATIQAG